MDQSTSQEGVRVKTVEFDGTNIETWKYSISIVLKKHKLESIVNGTRPIPTEVVANNAVTNQALINKWIEDDNLATFFLFNTCNEQQKRTLLTCTTAHSIWSSITGRFQQSTVERRHTVKQEFLNYRYNSEHCMRAHIEAIKMLAQQVRDAGGNADEEDTCHKIINSLPPSYNHFLTSWESTPITERTLDNLTTRLDREEGRSKRSNGGARSLEDKAFFGQLPTHLQSSAPGPSQWNRPSRDDSRTSPYPQSKNANSGRGRGRNRNDRYMSANGGRSRTTRRCDFCHIVGHDEKDCYYKVNGGVPCDHCHIYGHDEQSCFRKNRSTSTDTKAKVADQPPPSSNQSDDAYTAGFSSDGRSPTDFYLDSGATQHMSNQRWLLKNFTPFDHGSRWISGIGPTRSAVLGKGDVNITTSINGTIKQRTIRGVLYAPSIGINLLSVGAITQTGAEVHFVESQAIITRDDVPEMTAQRIGESLYLLDVNVLTDGMASVALSSHESLQEWHRRLSHISYRTIIRMASSGAVDGLNLPPDTQAPTERCHDCIRGKMSRLPFHPTSLKSSRIGLLIHSDVCGPFQVASFGGALYYALFKDDHSGFRVVNFLKFKSEVSDCFRNFVSLLHAQTGHLVAVLRSDNGGEFEGLEFQSWLAKRGIRHETTVRYTPQQNGVAERDNRTIVESARTLLHSKSFLPLRLWAEAINCVVYTLNRSLSSTNPIATPFETWYGRKPDVSNLRAFGSEFYVMVPKELRLKLDVKCLLCYFVGNSDTQKGDRYWDPTTGKVNSSRDVSPITHHYTPCLPQQDVQHGVEVFPPFGAPLGLPTTTTTPITGTTPPTNATNVDGTSRLHTTATEPSDTATGDDSPVNRHETNHPPTEPRRSTRIRKQKEFLSMSATLSVGETEPDQYQDAMTCDNTPLWKVATQQEYGSLMKNNTWRLVILPPNRSLIKSRWTFKIKPGARNSKPIYKARFVAKGFSQVAGIDYTEAEIYAPVVKHDSLRIFLSIAASLNLELIQLDVKTAFLYGDLDEELYVQQPEGFVQPGQEHLVCRLLKPLYGLKQSPRKWNEKFDSFLIRFGLTRSTVDPCIYFYRGDNANDYVILGIWVDDGLIASRTAARGIAIVQYLEHHFEMTSGPADRFIGLEITRDRTKSELYITQTGYIQNLLRKFRMEACNPSKLPADPHSRLTSRRNTTASPIEYPLNSTTYRALIGSLLYAACMTRPDIMFAVIAASRFCQNPEKPHWTAAKLILAHLAGTLHLGIRYFGAQSAQWSTTTGPANTLTTYSDSDFAGCPDTRRSTSGLLSLLNGGPVAWKSHLQKPVAQSTAEAEYYAGGHACRDIIWIRELLRQLGFSQTEPSPLFCDNHSAILMVQNPVFRIQTGQNISRSNITSFVSRSGPDTSRCFPFAATISSQTFSPSHSVAQHLS